MTEHTIDGKKTSAPARRVGRWTLGLATASAALLVAVGAQADDRGMGGGYGFGHGGPGKHHRMGGDFMGGPMGARMLDELKATPEQRTQLKQIFDSARKDLQARGDAERTLRQQMMAAYTQPNVDANAIEQLRQKMVAEHDQRSRRMSQAMLEASRVLTPAQRAQMAEKMAQRRTMMERHQKERQQLDGAPRG